MPFFFLKKRSYFVQVQVIFNPDPCQIFNHVNGSALKSPKVGTSTHQSQIYTSGGHPRQVGVPDGHLFLDWQIPFEAWLQSEYIPFSLDSRLPRGG